MEGNRLRAFTVKPLWAYLILNRIKDCENRNIAPTPGKGTAAVHVSSTYTRKEHDATLAAYPPEVRERLSYEFLKGLCGQICGLVNYEVTETTNSEWWDRSGKPIMLTNPKWLQRMVPCKGALQFWTVPDDVAAEVLSIPTVEA